MSEFSGLYKMNDENDLIDGIKHGDELTYKLLFERYYSLLCHFANAILKDPSLSEDVVDEVFLAIWQNRLNIDIRVSLRSYLICSVRNKCLNELKSSHHRMRISSVSYGDGADFIYSLFSDDKYPLGTLIEKEIEQHIIRCIESLPTECRIVFEKSRFDGMSYKAIAAELGISVNTVKYHIMNALSSLYRNLRPFLKLLIICFGAY